MKVKSIKTKGMDQESILSPIINSIKETSPTINLTALESYQLK